LPSNEVYQSFQDSKGFLWFCTDQGLARYNGYSFDYFSTDDGLTDNTIFSGHEDAQGRIWWVTFRGGLCYYENEQFFPHPANQAILELCQGDYLDNLCSNGDTLFFAPKNKFLIVSDSKTLNKIPPTYYYSTDHHHTLSKINLQQELPIYSIPPNHYSYQQSLTPIGTNQYIYLGISHYRLNSSFVLADSFLFKKTANRLLLSSMPLGHQFIDKNEHLVYSKNRIGLLRQHQLQQQQTLPIQNATIYHANRDQEGNIWLATTQGIFLYVDGNFNQAPQHFLSQYTISHINEDSEGNLWFSTLNHGVKMLPSLNIRQYKTKEQTEFSRLLSINNQYLLSLTKTGKLYQLSPQQGFTPLSYVNTHKQNAPMGIALLDTQVVVLGNGIKVDLAQKKTSSYLNNSNNKAFFYNKTLDQLFIGSHQGIQYLQNGITSTTSYQQRVNCFHQHYKNNHQLWVGSSKGLALYDMKADRFYQDQDSLLNNRILDIDSNKDGVLFLATKGAGLLIKQGNQTYQLNSKKGLCSNFIQCVCVENDSTIWVGSQRGLNKIIWNTKTATAQIAQYTEASGLPSNTINDILVLQNQLYLASDWGIIQYTPLSNSTLAYEIPIYSAPLQINGKIVSQQQRYDLKSDQKNIRFNFSAIHFQDANNVVYRYQLKGKDDNWIITTNRSVQYTNLTAGRYEFVAMARNNNGQWSTQSIRIPFRIHPHFSETWWFWSLLLLSFLSLLGWLVYLYIAYIKERITIEKMHIESEQKALRSQMNPHFIFNALNSVLYFIRKNNREAASNYLGDFSTLIRTILNHSKKEFIPLQDELESIQIYIDLEEQRLTSPQQSNDFSIQIADGFSIFGWQIPPMLIQPLIENAIRHGLENKKGERILEVRIDGIPQECLTISVIDNGIGRVAAQAIKNRRQHSSKHHSTGLENITNRLTTLSYLYKQDFSMNTKDLYQGNTACGTQYNLHIPYIKATV